MKPQGPKKSPKRADLKGKNDPKGSYYKKLKTKDILLCDNVFIFYPSF